MSKYVLVVVAFVFVSACKSSGNNELHHTDTVINQQLDKYDKGVWRMRTTVEIRHYPPTEFYDWHNEVLWMSVNGNERYSFSNVFDSTVVATYASISEKRKSLYRLCQRIIDTLRDTKNKIDLERKLTLDTLKLFQNNKP